MGLCDRRHGKRADGGLFRQVPEKQKKPGNPIISGFPGIDTKTALQFGRLFLYERLFLNMVGMTGLEPAASWSQTKHSTKLSYASSSTSIIISYLHRFVNTFFCFFVQIPPSFSLCPCRCEKERSKAVFCSEPYLTSLLKLFIIKQYKEFVFPHLFALAGLRV